MAQWFVVVGQQERGPFGDPQLRQLAASGKLTPEHLVRRDDMATPIKAGKIGGLFGEGTPPNVASDTTTPSSDQAVPKDSESSTKPEETPRGAAWRMKQNALLLKLQKHDLPAAETTVGAKAVAAGVSAPSLQTKIEAAQSLVVAAEQLRQPLQAQPHETITDKTKRIAADGKRKLQAEATLAKRKGVLADIGRTIFADAVLKQDPAVQSEIAVVAKLQTEIDRLQAELAAAPKTVISRKKIIGVVAVIGVLVAGYLAAVDLFTTSPAEAHQARLAQIASERDAIRERTKAETARIAAEAEARRVEAENDRQTREQERLAKAERERVEEELAAAKKADEEERRRLARMQQEAEEKEEAQRMADKTARETARQKVAVDQARREFATKTFGGISLDAASQVLLTRSAQKARVKVELRGRDLELWRRLLANQDYLAIINHVLQEDYEELPDESAIERAADTLLDTSVQLLVMVPAKVSYEAAADKLFVAKQDPVDTIKKIEEAYVGNPFYVMQDWHPHPDGIGLVQAVYLRHAPFVIGVGSADATRDLLEESIDNCDQELRKIKQRVSLGEMTPEDGLRQCNDLVHKVIEGGRRQVLSE